MIDFVLIFGLWLLAVLVIAGLWMLAQILKCFLRWLGYKIR